LTIINQAPVNLIFLLIISW